jgi:hypothetical protein
LILLTMNLVSLLKSIPWPFGIDNFNVLFHFFIPHYVCSSFKPFEMLYQLFVWREY